MPVLTPDHIQPRDAWTTAPHAAHVDAKNHRVLYVHYTETPGRELTTPKREHAAIRAIRDYHVNGRGYDDLAYSYVLASPWNRGGPATLYVGRGKDRIPASQQGANQGNWSVAVIASEHEHIMHRTVLAIGWLAKYLDAVDVRPHSQQNATSCPGPQLLAAIPEIRRLAHI